MKLKLLALTALATIGIAGATGLSQVHAAQPSVPTIRHQVLVKPEKLTEVQDGKEIAGKDVADTTAEKAGTGGDDPNGHQDPVGGVDSQEVGGN